MKVRLRNKETDEIKEQEIFMGDFPLMTHSGTFVINGAERVVVSQIVRSPGVYYGKETDLKTDLPILTATVIPYRGAWLEYETDANEIFWVRIDKNRKLPITCLIRALGLKTDAEILDRFGDDPRIVTTLEKDPCKTYEDAMLEIYRKLPSRRAPHGGSQRDPASTTSSSIPGATICPSWAATSSIRSFPCGIGWPATSWSIPWRILPPVRSSSTRATC